MENNQNDKSSSPVGLVASIIGGVIGTVVVGAIFSHFSSSSISTTKWNVVKINEMATVDMPCSPEIKDHDISKDEFRFNAKSYSCKFSGEEIQVSHVRYPVNTNVDLPNNNLKGSVDGSTEAVNGEIIKTNYSLVQGKNAVDYTIKGSDYYILGRNILSNKDFFQIMYISDNPNQSDSYNRIIQSFKLSQL